MSVEGRGERGTAKNMSSSCGGEVRPQGEVAVCFPCLHNLAPTGGRFDRQGGGILLECVDLFIALNDCFFDSFQESGRLNTCMSVSDDYE